MKYSREKFKNWLSAKPSEETFCIDGKCPIQIFMGHGIGLFAAANLDVDFADWIDGIGLDSHGAGHGWEFVIPAQCLNIISYLDSAEDRQVQSDE